MKTTIELPDDLLERSKALARRENSTLKALIEGTYSRGSEAGRSQVRPAVRARVVLR